MTDNLDYNKIVDALLNKVSSTTKGVGSTPTSVYGHGPGGLFSARGLSRPVFSAMILPRQGMLNQLPIRPTNETNPLFGIITGVNASTGSEPDGVCDDPKSSGTMKLCTHTFPLGRFSRQSRVFDVDRAGKVVNRGEFLDLQVMNSPLGLDTSANPTMPGYDPVRIAQNEVSKALFELGVSWSRDFAKVLYSGVTTNNTANDGYKEFYGFDKLINTGYRDAETGVVCPAADSIVRSFGDVTVTSNAANFVKNVTNIWRNLKYLASNAGLDPVNWVISMPFDMFYEITEIWPITYLTYRALAVPTGSVNMVYASDVEKIRDEMRGNLFDYTGQFLMIDGQKVPVVIDNAIPETENIDGSFTADMYFIPMTVLGNQPVTFMEYFNYDGPNGAMEMARVFAPGDSYYTTDNGRFMWHKKPPTNFCVQLLSKTEPRLLMLTPYVAARYSDIRYAPIEHVRSPFTDSAYFKDGGNTGYAAPSYYSPNA